MSQVRTLTDAKSTTIRATVTRADGRVEDYGVVAYRHRNPLITAVAKQVIRIQRAFRDRIIAASRTRGDN